MLKLYRNPQSPLQPSALSSTTFSLDELILGLVKYPILDWHKNKQRNLVSDLKGLPFLSYTCPLLTPLFSPGSYITLSLVSSCWSILKKKKKHWDCSSIVLVHYSVSTQRTSWSPQMIIQGTRSPNYSPATNLMSVPVLCRSVLGIRSTVATQALLSQSSLLPMRQTGNK